MGKSDPLGVAPLFTEEAVAVIEGHGSVSPLMRFLVVLRVGFVSRFRPLRRALCLPRVALTGPGRTLVRSPDLKRRAGDDSIRFGVDLPKALLFEPIHCT